MPLTIESLINEGPDLINILISGLALVARATEGTLAEPTWQVAGSINQGQVLAEQGWVEEGITRLRDGLIAWRALGVELARPYFLASLAGAYGKAGLVEEGLSIVTEALAAVDKTAEHLWEADLYRLKGELLLRQGEVEAEIESNFRQAIAIARQQQAKSVELPLASG